MDDRDNLIEPTLEERTNGWSAKALTAYVRERRRAQEGFVSYDPVYRPAKRSRVANNKYDPHHCWD